MAELTDLQMQVLSLLLDEHCTQIEIARRLRTSKQNVNQIVQRLRKYGVLDRQSQGALLRRGGVTQSKLLTTAKWRIHKLHFVIKPYYFEPRYHKIRKTKGNIFYSGDWRIVLHEDMVEFQNRDLVDFQDANKWSAIDKATTSFNKQLTIESNRYGFHVWKEGKANVRIADQHLEVSGSGVARGRKVEAYLAIRGEDNRVYLTFDKSKGTINHEYVGGAIGVSDSEKFEPYFNSIRLHPHYLPHEQKAMLDAILLLQERYAVAIEKHLGVLDKMSKTLDEISEGMRK